MSAIEQAASEICARLGLPGSLPIVLGFLRMMDSVDTMSTYQTRMKLAASVYFAVWNNVSRLSNGTIVRGIGVSLPQLLKECGVNMHDFLNKIFHICQILSSPKEMLSSLFLIKQLFSNLIKDNGDFDVLWRQLKTLRTSEQSSVWTETADKELAWHLHLLFKSARDTNSGSLEIANSVLAAIDFVAYHCWKLNLASILDDAKRNNKYLSQRIRYDSTEQHQMGILVESLIDSKIFVYCLNSPHDKVTMANKHLGIFHPSVLEHNVQRVSRTSQPMVSLETIDERLVLRPDYALIFATQTNSNVPLAVLSNPSMTLLDSSVNTANVTGSRCVTKTTKPVKNDQKRPSSSIAVDATTSQASAKRTRREDLDHKNFDPLKWKADCDIEYPEYLQEYFQICSQIIVDEIVTRLSFCKDVFCRYYASSSPAILSRVNWKDIFDTHFKGLKSILDSETHRLSTQLHPVLIKNELFHLSLFLCTWLVCVFKESTEGLDLLFVLDLLKISAYDFHKILGIYISTVWFNDADAKDLFHRVELSIIFRCAWFNQFSPLFTAIENCRSKNIWPVSSLAFISFEEACRIAQKTPERSLELIFSRIVTNCAQRIDILCFYLELSETFVHLIWSIMRFILIHKFNLIRQRRVDHILVSVTYFVCKVVAGENVSFKMIVEKYGHAILDGLSVSKNSTYIDEEFDVESMMRNLLCADGATGNIIQFYNDVFLPSLQISLSNLRIIISECLSDNAPLSSINLAVLSAKSLSITSGAPEDFIIISKIPLFGKSKSTADVEAGKDKTKSDVSWDLLVKDDSQLAQDQQTSEIIKICGGN